MAYDPLAHHRRSIRLRQYDYTQPGAYFITIVTGDRSSVFGAVEGNAVRLNAVGQMLEREWERLGSRFPNVKLDEFVVMPNHIHGILIIEDARTGTATSAHDQAPDEPRRAPSSDESPLAQGMSTATSAHDQAPDEPRRAPARDWGTAGNATDHGSGESRRAPTATAFGAPIPGSVATIVRAFKASTTLRLHRMRGSNSGALWHRNFYEHVIRDPADLNRIRKYIEDNPDRWAEDKENDR